MLIRRPDDILPSEITSKTDYLNRREFLRSAALASGGLMTAPATSAVLPSAGRARLSDVRQSPLSTDEPPNSYEDITTYNNFYEFGTSKSDPYRNSSDFEPRPCVEAWSMVSPWVGIALAEVIKRCAPTSKARYVAFETVYRPKVMPGQRYPVLNWPYREGLTIEEATHPLTILAVGLYGEILPNQNGAPLRLVVPWKYGFKGIKSIVRMSFVEKQPETSWEMANPREYGFYANVNPGVDHPRWSQATERRIGRGIFADRIPTQMFNGYGEQVASLYQGMDLRRNF